MYNAINTCVVHQMMYYYFNGDAATHTHTLRTDTMKTATHNGMTFTGFQKKSTHAIICIRSLADMEAEAAESAWSANRLVELRAEGRVVGNEVHLHFACASSLQLAEKRRSEKEKFGHQTYIVALS